MVLLSDSAPSFFHLVYKSPCPYARRRITCKLAPPLQLSPAKPAAQPTQPLNQTEWENYRPVPFILNKP